MKTDLHPDWVETAVKCNGCGNTFTSHSTVPEITVEICSNCHPFYTGKQKLLDTAGRVDKFKARQAAAQKHQKAPQSKAAPADTELTKTVSDLEDKTVDLPAETTEKAED